MLVGLAVAFAFRAGLFNIGGQGQYTVGAIVAVWVGSSFSRDAGRCCTSCWRSSPRRLAGAAWARDRRAAEGDHRRQRGDHHDHAQLDRDLVRRLLLPARRPAARTAHACRRAGLQHRRRREPSCRSSGAAPRSRAWTSGSSSRSRWRSCSAILINRTRLGYEVARGRLQPRRGASTAGMNVGRTYDPGDGDLRRVRGDRGVARHPGLEVRPVHQRHPGLADRRSTGSRSRCSGATPPAAPRSRRCCSARC